jgi:hypothetical protein
MWYGCWVDPWLVCTGAENFARTGIRYPERPARSESFYRLSYPDPPFKFKKNNNNQSGVAVTQLVEALRYKPEVAGSIPDGVTGIFHNRFGRTMALGSTQPPTEISTRNISWGVKAAGA